MSTEADATRPPSVDRLARSAATSGLPHPVLVSLARRALAERSWASFPEQAEGLALTLLRPVINATGVLLHTNLGRAPLAFTADAMPSNLEFDLASGRRGSRHTGVGRLLAELTGAEAAIVVNNNAAAVLLVLAALAADREVVVSRGESVEIGGAFRIPDVMARSGARLVDVGTTNRTRLADYAGAIGEHTALTLKVHASNFRVEGFSSETSVAELSTLSVPVIADIGSGLVDASCPWLTGPPPAWLADEPAARQTLRDGAALVTFSADKLLGGPQAGIVAGRADLVAACAKHPLMRALRPGSLVLTALQDTVLAYLDGRVTQAVPFWRMVDEPVDRLRERAEAVIGAAPHGEIVETEALPGAGSLPGRTIPSIAVAIDGDHLTTLRRANPPVIARVALGRTLLDLRSVDPDHDRFVAAALASCAS